MNVEEAVQLFINARTGEVSTETIEWYKRRLGLFVQYSGTRDVKTITIDDLRAYRVALIARTTRWETHPTRPTEEGGFSPYTLHQLIRTVRTFFKWLQKDGKNETNPAEDLGLPELPETPPKEVTEADLKTLLNYAKKHASARDYALLCFIADTNVRAAGVTGLKIKNLDLTINQALVMEKGNGGNQRGRYVSFKDRTAQALRIWLEQHPGGEYVFCSTKNHAKPLTTSGVHSLLERMAKEAGVTGRHNPHGFRHGWAMGALRRGADLATVSQAMGHSSITVTAKFYARWSDRELRERHKRFSRLPDDETGGE